MQKISKYFSYKEVIHSDTADKEGIDNSCSKELLDNASKFATECLDKCREEVNEPMIVDSWYRCEKLNVAVKGSKTSKHKVALAADIKCKDEFHANKMFNIISKAVKEKRIRLDQLILESMKTKNGTVHWIHIGYSLGKLRNQIMIKEC